MEEENKKQLEETIDRIEDKIEDIKDDIKEKIEDLDTADETAEFTDDDISKNKIMAILSYLGILVLVPIFCAKESKFARFHANQGLILLVAEVVSAILSNVPVIKWFTWILELAIAVLIIVGIINAAKGKAKRLPVIGSFDLIS